MTSHNRWRLARHSHLLALLAGLLAVVFCGVPSSAATGWAGIELIDPAVGCYEVAVAIDSSGQPHVVASESAIRSR